MSAGPKDGWNGIGRSSRPRSRWRSPPGGRESTRTATGELTELLDEHDRTNAPWFDYEIDVAELLDFPMMTDMLQSADGGVPQGHAARRPAAPGASGRHSRRPQRAAALPERRA